MKWFFIQKLLAVQQFFCSLTFSPSLSPTQITGKLLKTGKKNCNMFE